MKHKFFTRLLSLLLVVVTLAGLLIPASAAASLGGSGTVRITQDGFGSYLSKTSGGTIGGGYWKYTSNDGLTGSAYCVNWGLTGVSPSKALTVQPYSRNPQTMGAFTNGYPNRTLAQFKELHPNDVRGIAQLTETEYKYATQVAVWATCGQISVPGTSFTAGRTSVIVPTSDARQIRIYDSAKAILALSAHWTKYLHPGLSIRAEEDQNIPGVEVVHADGLAGAASANQDGIKKETINGKEYYARVMYVASATTTWIDGYTTKVYSTDAPEGTVFVAENNSALEAVQENGATCYKVNTQKNRPTSLNANGEEYYGAFKVCIPADNVADEGSFTIKATGGAAQFNLFLANNPSSTEQSYIISDPAYTTVDASAPFKVQDRHRGRLRQPGDRQDRTGRWAPGGCRVHADRRPGHHRHRHQRGGWKGDLDRPPRRRKIHPVGDKSAGGLSAHRRDERHPGGGPHQLYHRAQRHR